MRMGIANRKQKVITILIVSREKEENLLS